MSKGVLALKEDLKLVPSIHMGQLTTIYNSSFRESATLLWTNGYTTPPIHTHTQFLLRVKQWGWRDGSAVKSTDCSSRGPEFNSQQPHGGSQPSVMGSNVPFWCV